MVKTMASVAAALRSSCAPAARLPCRSLRAADSRWLTQVPLAICSIHTPTRPPMPAAAHGADGRRRLLDPAAFSPSLARWSLVGLLLLLLLLLGRRCQRVQAP